jgi:HAD superfamily hydrolase (TIGR01459 family)
MIAPEELFIKNFDDLIDRYDYFLLDAYGVFWGSAEIGMLPGAREAMEHLVSLGKKVGILSNSTQLVAKEKEKLAKHGVQEGVHYHFLLTSGEVARELLILERLPFPVLSKKYWLFGAEHPRFHLALFQDTEYSWTENLKEADFIYIPVPHIDGFDQEDPEVFLKEVQEVATRGIPILCANPDCFAHEGSPSRLVVRQGMIAHMLQTHGASVHFIGKPFATVYEKALQLFSSGVQLDKVLMIGDTPETDIRGARGVGLATALVTETGGMRERIGISNLFFALSQLPQSDLPDYVIERFGIHDF